jgi:hypothetical protein
MGSCHTVFGSLDHYEKGGVHVIDGDPKLIVWENNDDRLSAMYGKGELKLYPVEF